MGRPPNRPEMIDIELVEDEPESTATSVTTDDDAGRSASSAATRSRHLGRLAAAVLGVVSLVVVGIGVAQYETADEGTGVLTGASRDLTTPLQETWRVEARGDRTMAGGLLMTTSRDRRGFEVVAHDLADGTERWRLEVLRTEASGLDCPTAVTGESEPWVVCQARGDLVPAARAGVIGQDPGRLLLVDAADGAVRGEMLLEPRHVDFAALDGDLMLAYFQDGDLVVERRSPGASAPQWQTVVPIAGELPRYMTRVVVEHGAVVVTGPTFAVLDGADGSRLGLWDYSEQYSPRSRLTDLVFTPQGFAVRAPGEGRGSPAAWFSLDGEQLGELAGNVTEPDLSDGSQEDIVLTRPVFGASLRGVDVAQDVVLWAIDANDEQAVLRHDGTVVLAGDRMVRGIDLRTGSEQWRSTTEALRRVQKVSDGRFLLVTGRTLGVGESISAVSLTDGSLLWRVPMPEGGDSLRAVDGHVVAVGPGAVIGLG